MKDTGTIHVFGSQVCFFEIYITNGGGGEAHREI